MYGTLNSQQWKWLKRMDGMFYWIDSEAVDQFWGSDIITIPNPDGFKQEADEGGGFIYLFA